MGIAFNPLALFVRVCAGRKGGSERDRNAERDRKGVRKRKTEREREREREREKREKEKIDRGIEVVGVDI